MVVRAKGMKKEQNEIVTMVNAEKKGRRVMKKEIKKIVKKEYRVTGKRINPKRNGEAVEEKKEK